MRDTLSVQVHPLDQQTQYFPTSETGKTEAWVVLAAGTKSRIYAGLKPVTTTDTLRQVLANGSVVDHLASFTPKPGDGIFIPVGTVHSLDDVVVFEVQENSDVTFRLYDKTKFAADYFLFPQADQQPARHGQIVAVPSFSVWKRSRSLSVSGSVWTD